MTAPPGLPPQPSPRGNMPPDAPTERQEERFDASDFQKTHIVCRRPCC